MVRRHSGIIQSGGMRGRLKKGYYYTGGRTLSGLAEIKAKEDRHGEDDIKHGRKLWDKISYHLSSAPELEGDDGVEYVKGEYKERYAGKTLMDIIFRERYDPNTLTRDDITKVWKHGNTIQTVTRTITAAIPGTHIYTTMRGDILGVVIRRRRRKEVLNRMPA